MILQKHLKIKSMLSLLLTCTLAVLLFLEFSSFICQLLRGFFGENSIFAPLLNAESSLFYASSSIAPLSTTLLMFSWLPLIIFKHFLKGRFKSNLNSKANSLHEISSFMRLPLEKASKPSFFNRNHQFIAVFSLMSVLLITVYPYLPALNPSEKFVGVDIPFYEKKLVELKSLGDFPSIVSAAFFHTPDRPLSILLLFFTWRLTWLSALEAAQFSPIILGLILILCTFLFARLLRFNFFSASLIMLFTSFSFHVTVGMYGGFIANWIALIFLYAFWGFIFVALKRKIWSYCLPAVVLQGLLMFSHVDTWAMSMGILFILFLLFLADWISKRSNNFEWLMLLCVLVCGILLNMLRNNFLNVNLGNIEAAEVAKTSLSLGNLLMFWHILNVSLISYKGISFMNPILFILAFIGSLAIVFNDDLVSKIFKAFIIASAFPFLLGDQIMQTRIMYNLPLQIFASLGLYTLTVLVNLYFEPKEATKLNKLLVLLVVFVNLNYALRCSFHLTTINFFPE